MLVNSDNPNNLWKAIMKMFRQSHSSFQMFSLKDKNGVQVENKRAVNYLKKLLSTVGSKLASKPAT